VAIKQLEGYRGSIRDFITPISESAFGGDVLKFHDAEGNPTGMTMNMKKGQPMYSTDICNYGIIENGIAEMFEQFEQQDITGSNATYQEFHPNLSSTNKIKNGTLTCKVNGVRLDSDNDQTKNYNGVEFFLDTTQTKLRIRKLYVKDDTAYGQNRELLGIDLGISAQKLYSDRITIRYQQEVR
jgi:hypothetical protein